MSNLPPKANLSFYTHIYNEYSIEEYHLNNSLADYYDYLRNTKDLLNTTESFYIPVVFHVIESDMPRCTFRPESVNIILNYLSEVFKSIKFVPALRDSEGRDLEYPGLNIVSDVVFEESRLNAEGVIETYEYDRDGITMETVDPNVSTGANSTLFNKPVKGITAKLLKDTIGFDPFRYFNIYLVNFLRDQADLQNSLLASSINPVIAVKNRDPKSFGVIVPYYSIPKDLYFRESDTYLDFSFWPGMDSYIWLTHAVGNSLGLVTTSNYKLDYRFEKKQQNFSYFSMGTHSNECRDFPCIFEDPEYQEAGRSVYFTNKHSGPCINQESVPFEVFKNNAKDPLDCNGNPLRIDNVVAGIYPYARILDMQPEVTEEQESIIRSNLFVDFYENSSEVVLVEQDDPQAQLTPTISRIYPGILHSLILSTVGNSPEPEPCVQPYPYTLSDTLQYSLLTSGRAASNLRSVIKNPIKTFTYERSNRFESLLNRLQTLVNNIKYD